MVSNNSSLAQDWGEITSGIASGARAVGQSLGLVAEEVIPGDPAEVGEAGEHLSKLGAACERVGSGIQRLDAGDWTGQAAEAFHANYLQVAAPQWTTAADAFTSMGQALTQYAQVLAEQQRTAMQAQAELDQAKKQATAAAEAHNAQLDAGTTPPPFEDPTAQRRAQAQHTIARAKETVATAGDRAAATMRDAAARAPAQPGLMAQLAEQASDALAINTNAVAGIATGFGQAVAGLGGLALGGLKAEAYFGFGGALIDPEGAHEITTSAASTASAAFSYSGLKTMVGVDTWKNHPTQAMGEAVPNALAYATGGGGAIAAASKVAKATKAARAGERAAEAGTDVGTTAERAATAPESAPRFTQAPPWHQGELPTESPSVRLLDEPDTPSATRDVPNESTPLRPSASSEQWPSARGERGFGDGPAAREPVGPHSRPEAHHHEPLDDVQQGEHHEPARDMPTPDDDGLSPDDLQLADQVRSPELEHLSDREILSLRGYRGDGYHDLNAHLRGHEDLLHHPEADFDRKTSDLDQALEKTPAYDAGPVYRGISVSDSQLDDLLTRYEPGQVVSDPAYTSTSTDTPFAGNVQMVIDSQQGGDLRSISGDKNEVLFPRDTPFRVTDRWYDPATETWQIHVTDP